MSRTKALCKAPCFVVLDRKGMAGMSRDFGSGRPALGRFFKFPIWGAREGGHTLRKDVFLHSKHLLSAFYKTLPSKNPSKNLVFAENPYRRLLRLRESSKNPSKKRVVA